MAVHPSERLPRRTGSGLAGSGTVSFESVNFPGYFLRHPDRYIRHYAYQLRLDPITTATGRDELSRRHERQSGPLIQPPLEEEDAV